MEIKSIADLEVFALHLVERNVLLPSNLIMTIEIDDEMHKEISKYIASATNTPPSFDLLQDDGIILYNSKLGIQFKIMKQLKIIDKVKKLHRPPLGIKPKFIHDEQRFKEVQAAIFRSIEDPPPQFQKSG